MLTVSIKHIYISDCDHSSTDVQCPHKRQLFISEVLYSDFVISSIGWAHERVSPLNFGRLNKKDHQQWMY